MIASAVDVAKYFMKRGLDNEPGTQDGNIKLQKLLLFADLISIAETGEPLFYDDIFAFKYGCVVENVRLKYSKDYQHFYEESLSVQDFSQQEQQVLDLTEKIFGKLQMKELVELAHTFDFWKKKYVEANYGDGHVNTDLAKISVEDLKKEIDRICDVIDCFKNSHHDFQKIEKVNGITFYYDSNFEMNDKVIEELEKFSLCADETVYTVYKEENKLVIY